MTLRFFSFIAALLLVWASAGSSTAQNFDCDAFIARTNDVARSLYKTEPLAAYVLYDSFVTERNLTACESPVRSVAKMRRDAKEARDLLHGTALLRVVSLFGALPGGSRVGEGSEIIGAPVTLVIDDGGSRSVTAALQISSGFAARGDDDGSRFGEWLADDLEKAPGVAPEVMRELVGPSRDVFIAAATKIYDRRLADWTAQADNAPRGEVFWKGFAGQLDNELGGAPLAPLEVRVKTFEAIEAYLQKERAPAVVTIPQAAFEELTTGSIN